jgi:hypothetical protein
MRSIAKIVDEFKQNWTREISQDAIARAARDAGMAWNESKLNPVITIQIFFLQILHGNTACEHLSHLAAASIASASRSFLTICSGECRFLVFIESPFAILGVRLS